MAVRRRSWPHLIPGLVVLAVLVLGAIAVLAFARVGALHGDTYRLYVRTNEARGLMRGSDVWLAGRRVGIVADISYRTVTNDTAGRLSIALDVLAPYREQIRGDSYAQIRSGGSLIGAPVVWVSPGTPAAQVLPPGGVIPSKGQLDTEDLTSQIALASRQFPAIIANARAMRSAFGHVRATLAGAPGDEQGAAIRIVGARASRFGRRALSGSGTVGLLLANEDLLTGRAQRAIARADSVVRKVDASGGTVGRLQRDSALLRAAADVRNEVSIVRALLEDSRGTAGRFSRDSALVEQLRRVERELGRVVADLKRDPARYVAF